MDIAGTRERGRAAGMGATEKTARRSFDFKRLSGIHPRLSLADGAGRLLSPPEGTRLLRSGRLVLSFFGRDRDVWREWLDTTQPSRSTWDGRLADFGEGVITGIVLGLGMLSMAAVAGVLVRSLVAQVAGGVW